jgi:hypothetical protein
VQALALTLAYGGLPLRLGCSGYSRQTLTKPGAQVVRRAQWRWGCKMGGKRVLLSGRCSHRCRPPEPVPGHPPSHLWSHQVPAAAGSVGSLHTFLFLTHICVEIMGAFAQLCVSHHGSTMWPGQHYKTGANGRQLGGP